MGQVLTRMDDTSCMGRGLDGGLLFRLPDKLDAALSTAFSYWSPNLSERIELHRLIKLHGERKMCMAASWSRGSGEEPLRALSRGLERFEEQAARIRRRLG